MTHPVHLCPACSRPTFAPYSETLDCCVTLPVDEIKRRRLAGEEIPLTELQTSGGGSLAPDGTVCCGLTCVESYVKGERKDPNDEYGWDSAVNYMSVGLKATKETKVEAAA